MVPPTLKSGVINTPTLRKAPLGLQVGFQGEREQVSSRFGSHFRLELPAQPAFPFGGLDLGLDPSTPT